MTQAQFTVGENPTPHQMRAKLNMAVQGYRFLRRTTFTGLPEPVFHAPHGRATALFAVGVGPGGGGAGAAVGGAGTVAVGGGGGAGGYCETVVTSLFILRSTLKVVAPVGGPGGPAGQEGGDASAGATISYPNAVGVENFILGASAGGGGVTALLGMAVGFAVGGPGGNAFSGLLAMTGENGGVGIRFGASSSFALGGRGGASRFRGYPAESSGVGFPAASYGAGGGGAASLTQAAGGAGGNAFILIDEYY